MSEEGGPIDLDLVAEILARTLRLALRFAWQALLAFILIAGPMTAARLLDIAQFPSGLVGWAIILLCQYHLVSAALVGSGLAARGDVRRRLWPMVGLCLISEFAIIATFGLLLIGLILAARWLIAGPILLAERRPVMEALGQSWEETEGLTWPLVLVLILLFAPFLLLGAAVVYQELEGAGETLLHLLANLAAYAGLVLSWLAAVAAYSMAAKGRSLSGRPRCRRNRRRTYSATPDAGRRRRRRSGSAG
jgi:hypothetical protein